MPELIDPPAGTSPEVLQRFAELADAVRAGDAEAKENLKNLFTENPELYRVYGDMAAAARASWIDLATQSDAAVAMAMSRNVAEIESELIRPGATKLEKLLATRVATCHLMVAIADALASSVTSADAMTRREAMDRQRSANAMLLAAARTLATCQKLLKPGPTPIEMLRPQAEQAPRESPATERARGRRTGCRAGVLVGEG